jgi:hypothetical protein
LFEEHASAIPQLKVVARSRLPTFHHPLASEFMQKWARNATWGVCDYGRRDVIGVNVPPIHLERLAEFGGIESFSFMLGDRADFCCASLVNNDNNREFGLIVNCPMWIELASHEEFQWSFDRRMNMVIQHEMAHFRHQNGGERSEIHAHCRGVASVFRRDQTPDSQESFVAIIHKGYPDITNNDEIRRLVLNGQASRRLVRLWLHLFKEYGRQSHASEA